LPGPLKALLALVAVVLSLDLSGCATVPLFGRHLSAKECLMRAMYFESNRSSEEGMLAVGTVVMNRVGAPGYAGNIWRRRRPAQPIRSGVPAPADEGSGLALASRVADRVLAGARHPALPYTTHFHTAGLTFPYNNMHYVLEAGGNAFYEIY